MLASNRETGRKETAADSQFEFRGARLLVAERKKGTT